jgi:hypothetical protein
MRVLLKVSQGKLTREWIVRFVKVLRESSFRLGLVSWLVLVEREEGDEGGKGGRGEGRRANLLIFLVSWIILCADERQIQV